MTELVYFHFHSFSSIRLSKYLSNFSWVIRFHVVCVVSNYTYTHFEDHSLSVQNYRFLKDLFEPETMHKATIKAQQYFMKLTNLFPPTVNGVFRLEFTTKHLQIEQYELYLCLMVCLLSSLRGWKLFFPKILSFKTPIVNKLQFKPLFCKCDVVFQFQKLEQSKQAEKNDE